MVAGVDRPLRHGIGSVPVSYAVGVITLSGSRGKRISGVVKASRAPSTTLSAAIAHAMQIEPAVDRVVDLLAHLEDGLGVMEVTVDRSE